MIRVLIADDHAIVRKGLKQIVADTPDIVVVGEAANGHEVLDYVRREECDVVLLDIAMPGKDGLNTLKELKAARPLLPVLILSMYPEEQYAVRLLKAGASGYLTKESAPEELVASDQEGLEEGQVHQRVARRETRLPAGFRWRQAATRVPLGSGVPGDADDGWWKDTDGRG